MTDSIPLIPSLVIPAQTQLELRAPSASCLQSAKKKAGRQVSRSGCLNTSQQQEKLEEIAMMRATRIGGLIYPIYHLLRLVQPARFSISAFQGCNWDEEEKRQSRMRMQLGEQLLSTLCCGSAPQPGLDWQHSLLPGASIPGSAGLHSKVRLNLGGVFQR